MSYEKDLVNKGKHLAFLLRHDKDAFNAGLIDNNGWRDVKELCREHGYTTKMLDDIVETNNKKRYEFSDDKHKIRARQGHSICLKLINFVLFVKLIITLQQFILRFACKVNKKN